MSNIITNFISSFFKRKLKKSEIVIEQPSWFTQVVNHGEFPSCSKCGETFIFRTDLNEFVSNCNCDE
jgi:hypothetical protein